MRIHCVAAAVCAPASSFPQLLSAAPSCSLPPQHRRGHAAMAARAQAAAACGQRATGHREPSRVLLRPCASQGDALPLPLTAGAPSSGRKSTSRLRPLLQDTMRKKKKGANKSLEGGRQEKVELIKGMTTAEASQFAPLPQETLIIWGEFDQIFPLEKAYKAKEKLEEKATVKVIPNSGHLPSQEEPKLFNRVLLEFLLQPSISNGN